MMGNRYDKYKDSGIAWIGEIPEHWSKNKIIRLFSIIGSGTTPKSSKEDNYNGSINWIQSGDINGGDIEICKNTISYTAFKEYPALKIYQAPFIIVAMYGASVGNISISQIDGCVNQACCVMNETKQNFKYLFYAMNSVKKYLIYRAEGGGQPNISQDKIKNTWLPIPPLFEQQSISTYLDQKCGEIDELITLQEKMITKLQSYKQSVITEAVTKGLDKNVPLKDSGIEWIGKIPEHWNICQLKRCANIINGYAFNSNHFSKDLGVPVIRIGDIINEMVSFENIVYVQGNNELDKFQVHKNDILIAMSGATVGKIGIYDIEDKAYVNQRVGIIRTKQYGFIKRMFATYGFANYVTLSSAGSAQPNISSDGILNFYIPLPPIREQQTIADYLDQRCSEIDELISIKQQKIEKLKEYKKSLIFECVTGKRKVS